MSPEYYIGEVTVSFTLCLNTGIQTSTQSQIFEVFKDVLSSTVLLMDCMVPVYCFMPDHQHILLTGKCDNSDTLKTIKYYKQKTGFWLSKNSSDIRWQKNFYDKIIKSQNEISTQVRYILDNPVRKGIVVSWEDYLFKGSIGCNIEDVLDGIY